MKEDKTVKKIQEKMKIIKAEEKKNLNIKFKKIKIDQYNTKNQREKER